MRFFFFYNEGCFLRCELRPKKQEQTERLGVYEITTGNPISRHLQEHYEKRRL